jgi:hypothetical protein
MPMVQWYSSLDGYLGTGVAINNSDLSPGVHVLTLQATDSDGIVNTDAVTVTITD